MVFAQFQRVAEHFLHIILPDGVELFRGLFAIFASCTVGLLLEAIHGNLAKDGGEGVFYFS